MFLSYIYIQLFWLQFVLLDLFLVKLFLRVFWGSLIGKRLKGLFIKIHPYKEVSLILSWKFRDLLHSSYFLSRSSQQESCTFILFLEPCTLANLLCAFQSCTCVFLLSYAKKSNYFNDVVWFHFYILKILVFLCFTCL